MIDYISLGYTKDEQEMLQDAYQAIEKTNMWDYMKQGLAYIFGIAVILQQKNDIGVFQATQL